MKIINPNLGYKLWGMSLVLWLLFLWDQGIFYPFWAMILSTFVFGYFLYFEAERFTEEYKGVI